MLFAASSGVFPATLSKGVGEARLPASALVIIQRDRPKLPVELEVINPLFERTHSIAIDA
jgi:hypothetical protein